MMKKIRPLAVAVIAAFVLFLGILPVIASDSSNSTNTANQENTSTLRSAVQCEYPAVSTRTGETFTFNLAAADPDNDILTFSASNLPPGATFDMLTGTFTWTPGYDQAGIYPNIHFEVSDGQLTDSEDITITVINFNRPPALNSIGDKTVAEQNTLEFTVVATDPDNDALVYSASHLPVGAVFNPQTGIFTWTPGVGQQGVYSGVSFTVSDGTLMDSEGINITVTAGGNTPPAGPVFAVSDLSINPSKVNPGKKVNIRVLATNSGTSDGTCEVTLRINGLIEDTKLVKISAGSSVTVSFTTYQDTAGNYTVDVNGLSGSFEVNALGNSHSKPSGRKA